MSIYAAQSPQPLLGDADAVDYRFIDLAARGPTLQSGEVDLLEHDHHMDVH